MKKLLVVLSVVLVLALASGALALSGHTGHISAEDAKKLAVTPVSSADIAALKNNSVVKGLLPDGVDFGDALTASDLDTPSEATTAPTNSERAGYIAKVKRASLTSKKAYFLNVILSGMADIERSANSAFLVYTNGTARARTLQRLLYRTSSTADYAEVPATVGTSGFADGTDVILMFIYDKNGTDGLATLNASDAGETGTIDPELFVSSSKASIGSSGGGCVAGTSALALAVLGLFIAKGKK